MNTKEDKTFMKYPGELKMCEKCLMNLRQCEMMTSCVPCLCDVWNNYIKTSSEESNVNS